MWAWLPRLQFRKTKAEQEALGSCNTMAKTGVTYLCPVEAPDNYWRVFPGRFHGVDAHNGTMLKGVEAQFVMQRAATAVGLLWKGSCPML